MEQTDKVSALTIDNVSDRTSAMKKINNWINVKKIFNKPIELLHIGCISHILNLNIKNCLDMIHGNVHSIIFFYSYQIFC